MLKTEPIDYHSHLPPYRSLLSPNARYDYQTHSLVPLTQNDLNVLRISFQKPNKDPVSTTNGGGFKMKYKSLLSDVGRSISLKMSNPNLVSSVASVSTFAKKVQQHAAAAASSASASASNSIGRQQQQPRQPLHLKDLPVEVLDYIFYLVDSKSDYKSCMYTNKMFYQLAKPYYYQDLSFVSTYRFAQFISYLRLNSNVGMYVKSVDLSGIKSGYEEDTQEGEEEEQNAHDIAHREGDQVRERIPEVPTREVSPDRADLEYTKGESNPKIMAGWRDWKFKSNPLYSVHPSPPKLTKISSNVSIASAKSTRSSLSATRLSKPFKYFRSKKRRRSVSNPRKSVTTPRKVPKLEFLDLRAQDQANSNTLARNASPHPLINKFLMNYSTSKDIPIGYILHLIRLCPNAERIDLGNLSLSIDYEISRSMVYKYQTFDLMNNYPKDLIKQIDGIMQGEDKQEEILDDILSIDRENSDIYSRFPSMFKNNQTIASGASSVYSITTFSKPIYNTKFNSLLPPLPPTVSDISYINKGDGKIYLSDLNLKSINNIYLKKIKEEELLSVLIEMHGKRSLSSNLFYSSPPTDVGGNLKYLNLSSMIWLNRSMIETFFDKLLVKNPEPEDMDYDEGDEYDSDIEDEICRHQYKQDLVVDLSDSGMYKNLEWAKRIDLNTLYGCRLANKIIRNELLNPFDEFMARERNRRGRIGENYLA
ncbi:F-box protein [Spathaspora sp. JA1]|nr:F-box protein [Spathaspora sp. JA1]